MTTGYEIGVDTGGTFTDLVCRAPDGREIITKVPSTPDDPGRAVIEALQGVLREGGIAPQEVSRFVHGTTVATNAIIERQGAKIGLLTTAGFRDVLEIGRQMRSAMYELILTPETPVFLAPGEYRKEVPERVAADGTIVSPLDEVALRAAVQDLLDLDVDAIAVCFLFSFLNPSHEKRAAAVIEEMAPGLAVSISSEVDPRFREYERTVATCFDAYLKPIVGTYLTKLEANIRAAGVTAPLQVVQSRGGISSVGNAVRNPLRLTLSGPAGGIVGGLVSARECREPDVITVDIGGTSSDIALIQNDRIVNRNEGDVDGFPVRVSMVDVHAIGAGGGSIAWIDAGGGLRVGPRSAGSMPGPACYGRGGEQPTVTDASVVLGYLNPDYFANGMLALSADKARTAIEDHIARPLGMTVEQAALGIHAVVNAQMAEGIRFVSLKQGYDPRGFALVAMGGGGGIHATALADLLGISRIVLPVTPGVIAAAGLVNCRVEHEATAACIGRVCALGYQKIQQRFAESDRECRNLMGQEGLDPADYEINRYIEASYEGQSFSIDVPVPVLDQDLVVNVQTRFQELYDQIFGGSNDTPVHVLSVRSVAIARLEQTAAIRPAVLGDDQQAKSVRAVHFGSDGPCRAEIVNRLSIKEPAVLNGPVVIEQPDTTTVVPAAWTARILSNANIILERGGEQ